jgi:hypothetical protein
MSGRIFEELKGTRWWPCGLFLVYMRPFDIDGNNQSQFTMYFKIGLCDLNTVTAEILMSWIPQRSKFDNPSEWSY